MNVELAGLEVSDRKLEKGENQQLEIFEFIIIFIYCLSLWQNIWHNKLLRKNGLFLLIVLIRVLVHDQLASFFFSLTRQCITDMQEASCSPHSYQEVPNFPTGHPPDGRTPMKTLESFIVSQNSTPLLNICWGHLVKPQVLH